MSGWYAASSADPTHDDQEIDLGGGWWAHVVDPGPLAGPIGAPWQWAVHDQWLADEFTGEYAQVVGGTAPTQDAAKAAAMDAYRTGHR